MADYASCTIDFQLLFCGSRQPLFSVMSRMFLSALRWVVVAIVLAAVCDICVDILPTSAQQNEIITPDRQGVDEANKLDDQADELFEKGRYADAEPLYRRSLAIREKVLGPDHPDITYPLNNLALLYKKQGRYADAEPLYKRALVIFEKALGPEHPNVATSLNNLAALYDSEGRYADAEPFLKRSLAIFEKISAFHWLKDGAPLQP
jgi:tetratricopeptide (TPR) repeat protein